MDDLTEHDFCERVYAGDWPACLAHGINGQFYDYDRVVVRWPDGSLVTYHIGENRSGYPGDSALAIANMILSAYARRKLDPATVPAQT